MCVALWLLLLLCPQRVLNNNEWRYDNIRKTSGYATWFTAGGAIRIAHYDVIDDVIIWFKMEIAKKWLERILVLVRSTI